MGSNFWKHVGLILAKAGFNALKASKWASDHPDVTAVVEQVAECVEKKQ